MLFNNVIGQEEAKRMLIEQARENRVPHAIMISGPEGTGKLGLALAFAHYLLCTNPGEEDACNECHGCKMFTTFNHPDLHFSFPVIKKAKDPRSDDFMKEWFDLLSSTTYFGLNHWLEAMGAENQQALIYVSESDSIQKKLALKSSMGGYKVMIIWLPEKMNEECANKLLKLIEEPPAQTVFIMVSEHPEEILTTITSRTQHITTKPIEEALIRQALIERNSIGEAEATNIAHMSCGSYLKALEFIHIDKDTTLFLDMFILLMRLAYQRKLKDLKAWSEQIAGLGRERQKAFLGYCQRMTRENFIYNFGQSEMNYQNSEEADFSVRFARFINERNVIGIMNELTEAQTDIERNVNPKMVFFDFAMKIIVLLKQ